MEILSVPSKVVQKENNFATRKISKSRENIGEENTRGEEREIALNSLQD